MVSALVARLYGAGCAVPRSDSRTNSNPVTDAHSDTNPNADTNAFANTDTGTDTGDTQLPGGDLDLCRRAGDDAALWPQSIGHAA